MGRRASVWISRPTFSEVISRLESCFDVVAEPEERTFSSAELVERIAPHDAVIVGLKERIGSAEIANAPHLRIVANLGVGYDNIDVPVLTSAGIAASNTPDVLNESVADYAWALMLGAARRTGAAERWLRAGDWRANEFRGWLGLDIHGRTLGILGMGRIGQAVARRAQGFGMRVLYHNRSKLPPSIEEDCRAGYVDKAELLQESDFLMVVLPLTRESRHVIGAAELACMKPTAVLVNVARGGVVDDAALAEALGSGALAAAALDVFEGEPALNPAFLGLDNVLLSPHIASATHDTRRAMTVMAVDNVLAVFDHGAFAGRPPSILNPQVLSATGRQHHTPTHKEAY